MSGAVTDATTVTVNVNGTGLPVTAGTFSGPVSLTCGANGLTTPLSGSIMPSASD